LGTPAAVLGDRLAVKLDDSTISFNHWAID
jgi:hypothetical protein